MYLFSRTVRLGPGNPEKQLAWALKMTEKVNQVSEVPVSLWTTVFSPSANRLAWTAIIEDLVTLETAQNKLMADSGYESLVEEAPPMPRATRSTMACCSSSRRPQGGRDRVALRGRGASNAGSRRHGARDELGVETAQRAGQITGSPTSFALAMTGGYGVVEWLSVYTSIEELQRGQEAIAEDADFNQKVDKELSQVYLPAPSRRHSVGSSDRHPVATLRTDLHRRRRHVSVVQQRAAPPGNGGPRGAGGGVKITALFVQ